MGRAPRRRQRRAVAALCAAHAVCVSSPSPYSHSHASRRCADLYAWLLPWCSLPLTPAIARCVDELRSALPRVLSENLRSGLKSPGLSQNHFTACTHTRGTRGCVSDL